MVLRVEGAKKRIALAPAPDGMKPGEIMKQVSTKPGGAVTGCGAAISKFGLSNVRTGV